MLCPNCLSDMNSLYEKIYESEPIEAIYNEEKFMEHINKCNKSTPKIFSKITIDFLPETNIEIALIEASAKAKEWNVTYVEFIFSGVKFSIPRDLDVNACYTKFREIKDNISTYKHVVGEKKK